MTDASALALNIAMDSILSAKESVTFKKQSSVKSLNEKSSKPSSLRNSLHLLARKISSKSKLSIDAKEDAKDKNTSNSRLIKGDSEYKMEYADGYKMELDTFSKPQEATPFDLIAENIKQNSLSFAQSELSFEQTLNNMEIQKLEAVRKAEMEAKKAAQMAEIKAAEEAYKKSKEEADKKAVEALEKKAKEDAKLKEKQEADKRSKEKAEKEALEKKAKVEAERKAKEEAEKKIKEELKKKQDAEKEEAQKKAKLETERKAKEEEEKRSKELQRKAKEEQRKKELESAPLTPHNTKIAETKPAPIQSRPQSAMSTQRPILSEAPRKESEELIKTLRNDIEKLKTDLKNKDDSIVALKNKDDQWKKTLQDLKNNQSDSVLKEARLHLDRQKKTKKYQFTIGKMKRHLKLLKYRRNPTVNPAIEAKYFPNFTRVSYTKSQSCFSSFQRTTDHFSLNPPKYDHDQQFRLKTLEKQDIAQAKQEETADSFEGKIGDRICVLINNGERCMGHLKYYGKLDGIPDKGFWCGIELDRPLGNHDGLFRTKRYFQCDEGHGIFVKQEKVILLKLTRGSSKVSLHQM